jgi:hypothetical protein
VHELPFKFQLISSLPENYEDNVCKIEFFVEARLKLDNNFANDIWDRKDFQILDPIDLNQLILPDVTVSWVHLQINNVVVLALPFRPFQSLFTLN